MTFDTSILSNITTLKLRKSFILYQHLQIIVAFLTHYIIYSGHNTSGGGILSSTGFKVEVTNVYFLMMMVKVM